jgi:hypothetical protein
MIKYVIKTGCKVLNEKSRGIRDLYYKKKLKGMYCKKCRKDTFIEFEHSGSSYVKPIINSCCIEFESMLIKNLNK